MDSECKQRISIYLDRELVKQADAALKLSGCRSRNEFVAEAIERYLADLIIGSGNAVLTDKLCKAITAAADTTMKKVSSGLFRYAVFTDMIAQMIADQSEYTDDEIKAFRHEAYNNVRRTKGRISLDDTVNHTGISESE